MSSNDASLRSTILTVPVQNILQSFGLLRHDVERALRTQLGDAARLREERRRCFDFLNSVHQHRRDLSLQDYDILTSSVLRMVECLDNSVVSSTDTPDHPPSTSSLPSVEYTGRPGRPRVVIDPHFLTTLSQGRATNPDLAKVFKCSSRTIRRRKVESELSEPGPPVYTNQVQTDGTVTRVYRPGRASSLSKLSDNELDVLMLQIYTQFPTFGRTMIDGYLMQLGERVPRARVKASYDRVIGLSVRRFAERRLWRRVYHVPGPNSLWHHDGQHALIRWKIILHGFIDGFSRFVLGVRAHTNNRADTVQHLFDDIASIFGYPSRVRGDHGTENLLVARRQEEIRGIGRGSYIWGKSVHNIRIERLWIDVFLGFGGKWKELFELLELRYSLNPDLDAHLWLLHYLFLEAINYDSTVWASTWNHHTLSSRTETYRTPTYMYTHGMVYSGFRGVFAPTASQDPTDDPGDGYGIDWDELDDNRIREHHRQANTTMEQPDPLSNPFVAHTPERMSHIGVDDPRCPFNEAGVSRLDEFVASLPYRNNIDAPSRVQLWISTLQFASQLLTINHHS